MRGIQLQVCIYIYIYIILYMNMSVGTSVCPCGGMHVTLVESKYVYVEVGNEDVCLSVSLSVYLLACI